MSLRIAAMSNSHINREKRSARASPRPGPWRASHPCDFMPPPYPTSGKRGPVKHEIPLMLQLPF